MLYFKATIPRETNASPKLSKTIWGAVRQKPLFEPYSNRIEKARSKVGRARGNCTKRDYFFFLCIMVGSAIRIKPNPTIAKIKYTIKISDISHLLNQILIIQKKTLKMPPANNFITSKRSSAAGNATDAREINAISEIISESFSILLSLSLG